MPIHHHVLSADLEATLNHKVDDLREVFFGGRYFSWIDICSFESSEVQLTGSDVIAVWALHDYWDPEFFEECICALSCMITGPVHRNISILPPVWSFFVKLQHKLLDVQGKHGLI